jgi:hypothetical protein
MTGRADLRFMRRLNAKLERQIAQRAALKIGVTTEIQTIEAADFVTGGEASFRARGRSPWRGRWPLASRE